MSVSSINQYYNNVDQAIKFGKSRNEQSVRNFFWMLLNEYAQKMHYLVIPEVPVMGNLGKKVYPDGTIKNNWGLDVGYWESKDEKDDIDNEISAKIAKGYPLTNILFEDTQVAVLFQRGAEVQRINIRDAQALDSILTKFFSFKSETVYQFETAIEKFKADIPVIVDTLRNKIEDYQVDNSDFKDAQATFWELCKAEINPNITLEDIREMMIQHILTSDIFNKIFDDPEFHRHNTIASELEKLVGKLFSYYELKNLLHSIDHYYLAINATAAGITDHHEKQKFLKVLYENFYKVYNPKAADRLGVVYTPNEIVQFMVKSTDHLLHKHFGKTLADKNVEILDPATGTGTFICEIIENAIPKHQLEYKFKNEIFANEIAILPYYVANLNIEFTYKQKMDSYSEFPNLCFVDTLDNIGGLDFKGQHKNIFGLSHENSERINRQNSKKISVIIGNPPYNANQLNENENNKNREYPFIDKRIKDTYIKESTAQKTKVYDMYSRFYRWAMDRIGNEGIIAFITNRSFIDSRTFDGFRKIIKDEFDYCYILDTRSDVRANPKIAGTTHNVFGIQTGVAFMFLVKIKSNDNSQIRNCKIYYYTLTDEMRKEEKLDWLHSHPFENIEFDKITPDEKNNWINLTDNDWDEMITVKDIFFLISPGVVSNRDDWVYDKSFENLSSKMMYKNKIFNELIKNNISDYPNLLKWSSTLKSKFEKNIQSKYDTSFIIKSTFRPYTLLYYYSDKFWSDRLTQNHFDTFGLDLQNENIILCLNGTGMDFKSFQPLASKYLTHLQFSPNGQCLPLYRYNSDGNRIENITDWALEKFRERYGEDSNTTTPPAPGDSNTTTPPAPLLKGEGRNTIAVLKSPSDIGEGEIDTTTPPAPGDSNTTTPPAPLLKGEGRNAIAVLKSPSPLGEGYRERSDSNQTLGEGYRERSDSNQTLGEGYRERSETKQTLGEGFRERSETNDDIEEFKHKSHSIYHHPVPPMLLHFAREMRKNPTKAEDFLWQLLRKKQLNGLKFRRQVPIEGFILDFFCYSARLCIELDGPIHKYQVKQDEIRTHYLKLSDIKVIRFTNEEVLENTEYVLKTILENVPEKVFEEPDEEKNIEKEDIFHYVYAVLHNPEYRKKYELNLKRDFPRIPFYDDFWKWSNWGKQLMDLHINFEEVEPFDLQRIDFPVEHDRKLKVKLKANKETGIIELDEKTSLSGIPKTAWEYKLGNRSALEWILDQYKEKKPSDPTIAEKFNTYQFADYKEKVIDLLQRVCTVSVKTMEIIEEMVG